MLVFSRRVGQTVMIGHNIRIEVLMSKGNRVRIGIAAPNDVPVHRGEIYERIQRRAREEQRDREPRK